MVKYESVAREALDKMKRRVKDTGEEERNVCFICRLSTKSVTFTVPPSTHRLCVFYVAFNLGKRVDGFRRHLKSLRLLG